MTCQSCGADDPTLEPVLRMYVTPGSWDQEATHRVLDGVEAWCFACRTQYPHQPAPS